MKKIFLNLIALITLIGPLASQTEVETGQNQRDVMTELTVPQRTSIKTTNTLAANAATVINRTTAATTTNTVQTGTNRRSPSPVVIVKTTREGVNIYSDGVDTLAFVPRNNAFIQVKTRQQAFRVATEVFEPVNDEAGQKLRSRKASTTGENATVIRGVSENRSKIKTKVTEEETL
jgi:hypothetical protein